MLRTSHYHEELPAYDNTNPNDFDLTYREPRAHSRNCGLRRFLRVKMKVDFEALAHMRTLIGKLLLRSCGL
jgi:hypothetical protein